MKSEMPTEAGTHYWAKHKNDGTPYLVAVSVAYTNELVGYYVHGGYITQDDFHLFDWHRIELPEGWR